MSAARAAARLALLALLAGAPGAAALAPQEATALPPGPVDNDAYLPVAEAPLAALRAGDAALLEALAGPPGGLAWTEVLERWREALAAAAPGDAVPVGPLAPEDPALREAFAQRVAPRWPDRDGSFARRTEDVGEAVQRRLAGLEPAAVALWSERFGGLAEERLAALLAASTPGGPRRAEGLAALERELPATRAALRAALALADGALEAGRSATAGVWLERARLHAGFLGDADALSAVDRRALALEALRPAPPPPPAWPRAAGFEALLEESHPLVLPGFQKPAAVARLEGAPGLAFLGDGRLAVQTTGTVWLLADRSVDERVFEPWRLAFELGQPVPRTVERTGRDWPMYPVARGDVLYLVEGRADGRASNLVQRVRAPRDIELPVAEWSLGGDGLHREDGAHLPLEEVLGAGLWEFQPGPLLLEDTLYVQARRWDLRGEGDEVEVVGPGEAQAWLLALDARTGTPRWRRLLLRGTDRVDGLATRFARGELVRTPARPLRATAGRLLVDTSLGAAFLVECADGRVLTSLRNPRRDPAARGWGAAARPEVLRVGRDGSPPLLQWAPADGEELIALRPARDWAPPGSPAPPPLVAAPPLRLGESEVLLGASGREALVLGRAGGRRTLSSHDLLSGARHDSIYLGRREEPVPGALVTPGAVLFAAGAGLYRLDRGRELYLDAHHPLRLESEFEPGGLWARGDRVYLLAEGALFTFRCR